MASRFFCPDLAALRTGTVTLDPDESRHAARVLRLGPGDDIRLFDGAGHAAWARVLNVGDTREPMACRVRGELEVTPRPRPELTVAAALPKGSRAEDLLNQLTQVGVDRFVPLVCERGVVQAKANKVARLERAALAAAKQCGAAWLTSIDTPCTVNAALDAAEAAGHGVRLLHPEGLAWPTEELARLPAAAGLWLLVGPEGGFTDQEVTDAKVRGAALWRLGPNVLRVETAAVAAAAVVRHVAPGVTYGPGMDPRPDEAG